MIWNEPKIKFYQFFFKGIKKPVIIEAYSKKEADNILNKLSEQSKTTIDLDKLEDFRIEMPIKGVSKRKRLGETFVWVGVDIRSDGWISEKEYLNMKKRKKDANKN